MSRDNERVIPTIPGPRRSDENPKPQVPPQRTGAYDLELLPTGKPAPKPLPIIGYDDAWGRPGAWDL